jgi:glycosyltransferase involved in cell wall biosynthesis
VIDHPISNYLESYSTKMFEYMACGVPVVCSDFPFWQWIIADADCGVTVDPMDPEAVAKVVESLVSCAENSTNKSMLSRWHGQGGRRPWWC